MSENSGSAYILVLAVMMTVFISLSIVLNISRFQIIVTNAYNLNINDYDMAVSGIEKTLNIINRELYAGKSYIYYELLNKLMSNLQNNVSYKVYSLFNKHKGNFFIHSDIVYNHMSEISYNYIIESLDAVFVKDRNNYLYSYTVSVNEGMNTHNNYEINVIIKPVKIGNEYNFDVESTVINETTSNINLVTGRISLNKLYGESMFYPVFEWRHEKNFLQYSVYTNNSVEIVGDVHGNFMSYQNDIQVNKNIDLYDNNWSYENPIIIINNENNVFVDISNFYFDGQPLPTIIINNTDTNVNLYTSNLIMNNFKGIVFSNYNIVVDNINIEGSIVSLGNVLIISNDSLVFTENKNIIFNIKTHNKELYYKVLDYLNITNFNSMIYNETMSDDELLALLKNISFTNGGKLTLFEQKNIMYHIIEIIK